MVQTLQALLFCKTLPEPPLTYLQERMVCLPPPHLPHITKTVIFDLDETLIHCKEDFNPKTIDHIITINFPDGERVTAGLNIRPYALETLRALHEEF